MNTLTDKETVDQLDHAVQQNTNEFVEFANSIKEKYYSKDEIKEFIQKINEENQKKFILSERFNNDLDKAYEEVQDCRSFAIAKINEININISKLQSKIPISIISC